MPYLLLPSLLDGAGVDGINNVGSWDRRGRAILKGISSGLRVVDIELTSAEVDSIPSMWARPLLFDLALYELGTNHPMHQRVLGEWRGLLAMLALKEWHNFPLTIEVLNIEDANPTDDRNLNLTDEEKFLKALHKIMPEDTLDPREMTWETLNIILFNEKPIGIISPTTLVCTAVSCISRISGVPWFDGKLLKDPVPKLNDSQKKAVAFWLENLYQRTLKLPDDNNKKARINGLLREFTTKLGGATAVFDFSSTGLGMGQSFFECMDKPVAPNDDGLSSSVELVPSRENPSPSTKLLVPDRTISKDWGVEPQHVFVWGSTTLATMQDFSGRPRLTLPDDVKLWSQKDFFTNELFVINQEIAFHEHRTLVSKGSVGLIFQSNEVRPILPITEELLSYLDVQDLNDRITFRQPNNNSSITVDLRLTLSGINGVNQDFVISKEYDVDKIKLIPTVPVLAIWPNFSTPNWKAYYTYFTTADQNTFDAKPFLAAGQISDPRMLSKDTWITKMEHFPEAMLCEYEGNKAGILLISVPEPLDNNGSDWSVGVDFGTSSTTVYTKIGTTPQPVTFDNRLLPITAPRDDSNPTFYKDFLSPNSEKTPFFSLFQRLGKKNTNEPLLDGHIYFLPDYKGLPGAENIISNLKWSINPQDRQYTPQDRQYIKVFLEQLCLQCAAEAVAAGAKKINWNFSVPLAFRNDDIGYFEKTWADIGSSCESATGLSHQVILPAQSESVVTAKFFDDTTNGFTTGAVCIDIGGETSDISIWYNNDLYWQTSLRFAGRHIFLNLFRENLDVLRKLDVDLEDIKLLENVKDENDDLEKFYAQADALIQEKGDEWLGKVSGDYGPVPEIQLFIQLISLGVAGLLYYVGLILNYLSKNDANFKPEIPSIYIGGNGSKILNWMAQGDFNSNNRMVEQCKYRLKNIIGIDNNQDVEISISGSPKEEAAYGLVSKGAKLNINKTQFDILAGEAFTESGKDCEWNEILTPCRLANRLKVNKNRLEQIEHFINVFNAGLGENDNMSVDLDDSLRTAIFDKLEKELQDYSTDDDPKNIFVEPLFILALKALLDAKQGDGKNKVS